MQGDRFEFIVGSPVYVENKEVGRLESIVYSPSQKRIVALVVGHGTLLHEDIVVPAEVVQEANERGVWLTGTLQELNRMKTYRPQEYVHAPQAWKESEGLQRQRILFAIPGVHSGLRSAEKGAARAHGEEVSISRTTRVVSHAGPLGNVQILFVDGVTGLVSQVGVQSVPVLGRAVIVPLDWASSISEDEIFVEADREQLERLPEYRPDDEIAEDIRQALWSVYPIRSMELDAIEVLVQDGIVTLRGNVASPSHRYLAVQAVKKVPGVLHVVDELVADDDLEAEVAHELANDQQLVGLLLRVDSHLGVITFEGRVPTPELQQRAVAIAERVPGVREVISHIVVK